MKNVRRGQSFGIAGLLAGVIVACTGADPELGASPDGGAGQTADGAVANPTEAGADCAAACDGTTLKSCDGSATTCTTACSSTPVAHCTVVHPSGTVPSSLMSFAGVAATDIKISAVFDTTTGAIGGQLRHQNVEPSRLELLDGIGFQVITIDETHKIGVWVFDALTIEPSATVSFTGANAVGLASVKNIDVFGVIDLRGHSLNGELCASEEGTGTYLIRGGPGGRDGLSNVSTPEQGTGGTGSGASFYTSGGNGGGGYGGRGGDGGGRASATAGAGGAVHGTPELVPLVGGSPGGGTPGNSSPGGGGGGAIHLLANGFVTIGNGTALGGINAGGCGGDFGAYGGSGGGGGSGGAILIDAAVVELHANGVLAAAGGSGGGSTGSSHGTAGGMGYNGVTTPGDSTPGIGSGDGMWTGGRGAASTSTYSGAAGGGGAGRIRINTVSGTATVPPQALVNPAIPTTADPLSPVTFGTATFE